MKANENQSTGDDHHSKGAFFRPASCAKHTSVALLFDPSLTSKNNLIHHLSDVGVRVVSHRQSKTKRIDRRLVKATVKWRHDSFTAVKQLQHLPGVHAVWLNSSVKQEQSDNTQKRSVIQEIAAGTSNFLAMIYLLALIPLLLMDVLGGGTDVATSLVTRIALVSLFATVVLSSVGPYVAGPGIVPTLLLVAFFASGIPWPVALGIAVDVGLIFTVAALFGGVTSWVRWAPQRIKTCIALGIGWYLIVVAFLTGGLGQANNGPFLDLVISLPSVIFVGGCIVVLLCYEIASVSYANKRQHVYFASLAALIGMLAATLASIIAGTSQIPEVSFNTPQWGSLPGPDIQAAWDWQYLDEHIVLLVVVAIDVVAAFQVMTGLSNGELGDSDGNPRHVKRAFVTSGLLATAGPLCGLPPFVVLFESSTGVQAGGRTMVTALVSAVLLGAVCFASSIATFIPASASAVALAYVGYSIHKAEWSRRLTLDRVSRYLLVAIVISLLTFGSLALAVFTAFLIYPIAIALINRKNKKATTNTNTDSHVHLTIMHWAACITSAVLLVMIGIM